jgi:glycosyltransferase involved in cell wall biosynthesis
MDPGIPVPPKGYGGIERIVELMARAYVELGHSVDILASEGSFVEGCRIHPIGKDGFPPGKKEMNSALKKGWQFVWKHRNQFDLIHNFGRLLYLLPVLNHPVKKIMCYQREITRKNIIAFNYLPNNNMFYAGCSQSLIDRAKVPGKWRAIPNAVDFNLYNPTAEVGQDAPLVFLGRIEKIKGCHTAIDVAKELGRKLIIAGNVSTLPEEIRYFEEEILPRIDGNLITYIGEVNDKQKNELLRKGYAMLMPIEWEEPFGIVMIEAMACGTPVVANKRGSVNEVVKEAVTGFVVNNAVEMATAVGRINEVDRTKCRVAAENEFSYKSVAKKYLSFIQA